MDAVLRFKGWLQTPSGALTAGLAGSLLLLAETVLAPWGPYFPLFALFTLALPMWLRAGRWGSFRAVMRAAWRLTLLIFLLDVLVEEVLFGWGYQRWLSGLGLGTDPFFSLDAAFDAVFALVQRNLGLTPDLAQGLFAAFVLFWAPLGEEWFYRGYLFGTLRQRTGFWAAAWPPALLFGLRHAMHLVYLWPQVPWAAAGAWALTTMLYGLYISYLYQQSDSLYPPIVEHILINLVWLLLTLQQLG